MTITDIIVVFPRLSFICHFFFSCLPTLAASSVLNEPLLCVSSVHSLAARSLSPLLPGKLKAHQTPPPALLPFLMLPTLITAPLPLLHLVFLLSHLSSSVIIISGQTVSSFYSWTWLVFPWIPYNLCIYQHVSLACLITVTFSVKSTTVHFTSVLKSLDENKQIFKQQEDRRCFSVVHHQVRDEDLWLNFLNLQPCGNSFPTIYSPFWDIKIHNFAGSIRPQFYLNLHSTFDLTYQDIYGQMCSDISQVEENSVNEETPNDL